MTVMPYIIVPSNCKASLINEGKEIPLTDEYNDKQMQAMNCNNYTQTNNYTDTPQKLTAKGFTSGLQQLAYLK